MLLPSRAAASVLLGASLVGLCSAQEWTEAAVIERFLDQSPYTREARARVAITRAESRARALYPNPNLLYSREGAGLTEFFQAEQILPISGRLKLLREAGASQVLATEADSAFSLWQARSSLRQAFYRLLSSQMREVVYANSVTEINEVIRVLREREIQGEGSKFDRLRTERERAEVLAEVALLRSVTALDRAQILAFLPENDVGFARISGEIDSRPLALDGKQLTNQALLLRQDYLAEQRRVEQYHIEQRAAERLRFPEPTVNGGLKRADVGQQRIGHSVVVGISIPLPLFHKGRVEVARFSAEQDRASARLQVLARQIRAAVEGNVQAFTIRSEALNEYRRELAGSGPELVRIATLAYQEGEISILQLLDTYRLQRQAQLRMIDIQSAAKEAQIELERVVGEELGK